MPARPDARLLGRSTAALAALALLHLLLTWPDRPSALEARTFLVPAAELPALLAALALAPSGWRTAVRWVGTALVSLVFALKLADFAAFTALGRPFDPVFDWYLVASGWALASGALGVVGATGAVVVAALALAAVGWTAGRALVALHKGIDHLAAPAMRLVAAALLLASAGSPALPLTNADLLQRKVADVVEAVEARRAFARRAARDALAAVPDDALLRRLADRDVLFLFVESYGRSAVEQPRYAPTIGARLRRFEGVLAANGYGARSGWLTAPIKGGQSWLAHATLLSGLEIAHQHAYRSLLASERRTLVHGFDRAGWRTVAVMPAITMPWPEARWFDYDAVYTADDLGYAGAPFNWVTMPDQYTLSALERLELARTDRPPVMAEVALISSHAPWTPIPPVLDWEVIDDGRVFTPHAQAGDPPAVVWRDAERVREQYLKAIDYALATLASYAAEHGRDDLVLVVVGDHQPAPLVTGEGAGFDVPVHVIGPADVLARIDGWGWSEGMRPAGDLPAWPMAAFRDRFVEAFSQPSPPPADGAVQASVTDSGA